MKENNSIETKKSTKMTVLSILSLLCVIIPMTIYLLSSMLNNSSIKKYGSYVINLEDIKVDLSMYIIPVIGLILSIVIGIFNRKSIISKIIMIVNILVILIVLIYIIYIVLKTLDLSI